MLTELISQSGVYAIVVVATVEALRKRIEFDGWKVLVIAAVVAFALSAMFLPATTLPELLNGLRVAFFAWLIAVGGDAWVNKIAKNAFSEPSEEEFTSIEAPTKKEGK